MENLYNAELLNNTINWIGEKPKRLLKNKKYKISVTIEKEKRNKRTAKELVEDFRNSPLFGIELDLSRDKDAGRNIEL